MYVVRGDAQAVSLVGRRRAVCPDPLRDRDGAEISDVQGHGDDRCLGLVVEGERDAGVDAHILDELFRYRDQLRGSDDERRTVAHDEVAVVQFGDGRCRDEGQCHGSGA
nr:hypothetical protein [Mycolicibacterium sp. CBMA 334]